MENDVAVALYDHTTPNHSESVVDAPNAIFINRLVSTVLHLINQEIFGLTILELIML